jgi:hypothetical protein
LNVDPKDMYLDDLNELSKKLKWWNHW